LGWLGRGLVGLGAALDYGALGVTDQPTRIQCQDLAWEVVAGPS
jgi:hypothetical protein